MLIRGMSVDQYLEKIQDFHGHLAPGLVAGGFMVELALQNLPENILYDAICETRACVPDAIQILTPCTIGNGWLRIIDTGRFALILYDKKTGSGVRVAMDPQKLKAWPVLNDWAMKLSPKSEQDPDAILSDIIKAETSLYKTERVKVNTDTIVKKKKIFVCETCGESYRGFEQGNCDFCSKENPFYTIERQGH